MPTENIPPTPFREGEEQPKPEFLHPETAGVQARLLVADLDNPISEDTLKNKLHDVQQRGIQAVELGTYTKASKAERKKFWQADEYKDKDFDQKLEIWREKTDTYLDKLRGDDDKKGFLSRIGIDDDTHAADFYSRYLEGGSKLDKFIGTIESLEAADIQANQDIIRNLAVSFGYQSKDTVEELISGVKNARRDPEDFAERVKDIINSEEVLEHRTIGWIKAWNEEPEDDEEESPPSQAEEETGDNGTSSAEEHTVFPEGEHQEFNFSSGHSEAQNKRPSMQDVVRVIEDFGKQYGRNEENEYYYGDFDGHGNAGKEVADHAAENLHQILAEELKKGVSVEEALRNAFMETNKQVEKMPGGTTAVVAYIKDGMLYVANAGDARAVMDSQGNPVRLSKDHKPDIPEEKKRIEDLGGVVRLGGDGDVARVLGEISHLAVSRAIGDSEFGGLVTAEPYISKRQLTKDDKHLIMASDGVWGAISDQEAVALIKDIEDPNEAAEKLKEEALRRPGNGGDNVSVIVVKINTPDTH